jgi:hypothetical protein
MQIYNNLSKSGRIADVALVSPCPVYVSTLGALPIISAEESFAFLSHGFANFMTHFILLAAKTNNKTLISLSLLWVCQK